MLNYEFPPLGGGGGKQSMYLAKEYAKNHDVYFLTTGYKEFGIKKKDGYVLDRLKTSRKNTLYCSNKEMMQYLIKAWKKIPEIVRGFKPDVVHLFFTIPTGLLTFHPKLKKTPYIVSVRGSDVPGHNPDRFSLMYKVLTPTVKKIWRDAKTVVCNSEDLRKEVLKISPRLKVKVIPNGIDTDKFKPRKRKSKNEKNKNEIRLLYAGRLIPLKRIDLIIRALPGVIRNNDKKIVFRIVGSGSEEKNLRNLVKELNIEKYVEFRGEVDYREIHKEYQDSDIYIQMSKVEGMSNTILEAMACGLPIITTDVGGAKKFVQGNGTIVDPKSSNNLSNILSRYLKDSDIMTNQGIKSLVVAKKMTFNLSFKKYEEYICAIKKI
ncbi:TPA: glycosyltransferase family 4 protein [Candidatus Woesearchaeota archaeon]|nr:glycosyltransferase family 4 protein [Candidatus Woesearchaeota archaeon]HIJ02522.1 glycosyltransferase family 4 protein [Candidatus Woesearchaeota archaeon]